MGMEAGAIPVQVMGHTGSPGGAQGDWESHYYTVCGREVQVMWFGKSYWATGVPARIRARGVSTVKVREVFVTCRYVPRSAGAREVSPGRCRPPGRCRRNIQFAIVACVKPPLLDAL